MITDSNKLNVCRPKVVFNFSPQIYEIQIFHLGWINLATHQVEYHFKTFSVPLWQRITISCFMLKPEHMLTKPFLITMLVTLGITSEARWLGSWSPCLFSLHYGTGKIPSK